MLLRLLAKRFGPINEQVRHKIETADADTLLTWSDRLLSADIWRQYSIERQDCLNNLKPALG